MAPRTLFNLILKVIGIFFMKDILEAFSHTLSALVYSPEYDSLRQAAFNIGVTLPALVLYSLLTWFFLFRTEKIIDLLRLERNFPDKPVSITVERSKILTASVIIAGAWIIVNEIPEFFRHAVYYYQERKIYVRMTRPDISYIIMSAIRIAIGLLLVLFNKPIIEVIEWGGKSRLPWQKKVTNGRRPPAEKRQTANTK